MQCHTLATRASRCGRTGDGMLKIVTVEREYGCGGGEIAQRLAERLGWKLWDQL